jgi:hypothetical protein
MASVTNTLPTVVRLRASMKAVNITLQHRPDSHSHLPPSINLVNTARP